MAASPLDVRSVLCGCLAGAFLLAVALVFAACGGGGERSATGVVIEVEASSLTQIDSFVLHTNDGRTLLFEIAPDAAQDPQEGFFPGHLRTHALAAEQVTVFYREEGDTLVALRLKDE